MIRLLARRALPVAGAALLLLAVQAPAQAAAGPADDRLLLDPTRWWMYYDKSPSFLTTKIDDHQARLTDLRVVSVSPLRFAAVMVKNQGAYEVPGWWWYYGQTKAQVWERLHEHDARPICLQAYADGSVTRYAVVMVSNSGSSYRQFDWAEGTHSEIKAARPEGYRPITLATYLTPNDHRHFVSIFVRNTEHIEWEWDFVAVRSALNVNGAGAVIDVGAYDNDGMALSVVFYHLNMGALQGRASFDTQLSDLRDWLGEIWRPLLLTSYTLHGDGTFDGETEFLAINSANW